MKHYRLLVSAGLLGLLGAFSPATAAAQQVNWGKLMPTVPQSPPPFTITTQVTVNDAPSTLEGVEAACAVCQGATCPATTVDREPLWGRSRVALDPPIAQGVRENRTLTVDVEVYDFFCTSSPCMSPTKSGTYDAFLSAQRTYGCVLNAVGRDASGSRRVLPFTTSTSITMPSFAKARAGAPLTVTLTGAIQ